MSRRRGRLNGEGPGRGPRMGIGVTVAPGAGTRYRARGSAGGDQLRAVLS